MLGSPLWRRQAVQPARLPAAAPEPCQGRARLRDAAAPSRLLVLGLLRLGGRRERLGALHAAALFVAVHRLGAVPADACVHLRKALPVRLGPRARQV